jgi:uncharacterized damage-inducible protein DinB
LPVIATGTEREALCGFLDQQRNALIRKIEGLSDEDARRKATVSSMSLLSLLKHSAIWERRWFQVIVAGRVLPGEWSGEDEERDSTFDLADEDTVASVVAYYREQIAISREIVAGSDLGTRAARTDLIDRNLRYVVIHMIEETARHAGHADIIRETIDGRRGL